VAPLRLPAACEVLESAGSGVHLVAGRTLPPRVAGRVA